MVSTNVQSKSAARGDKRFRLVVRGKTYSLDPAQAFALGHRLLQAGHYETAARIFEYTAGSTENACRGAIMLARCKAGLKDFVACSQILRDIFAGDGVGVAEGLHSAFVFLKVGMFPEAAEELATIVGENPQLPTPCLLLGDLYWAAGKQPNAVWCWKQAIKRDRQGGAVAAVARTELARMLKRRRATAKGPTPHEDHR